MASVTLTNLIASRDNISGLIAQITASPKPDYSVQGQSVSYGAYLGQLMAALRDLNDQIVIQQARDDGPYEIDLRGFSG